MKRRAIILLGPSAANNGEAGIWAGLEDAWQASDDAMKALARRDVADRNEKPPLLWQRQTSSRHRTIYQSESVSLNAVRDYCNAMFRNAALPRVHCEALGHSDHPLRAAHCPLT